MPDIGGRSALITGASRGIGLAVAQRLAADGYGLTLSARGREGLEAVVGRLRELGAPRVVTAPADMTDPEALSALVEAHDEAFDGLSVLVLNAGMGDRGSFEDYPLRRFDRMFAVNVRAPFLLLQEALPLLRRGARHDPERGAKVVALASSTGVYSEEKYGAYGASKAALINLVETFGVEYSGEGISSVALAPGYVDTDMTSWLDDDRADTLITPEDVATLVESFTRLSRRAVVKNVTVVRAGTAGYGA